MDANGFGLVTDMSSGPINLRHFLLASIEIFLGAGVGDGILVRIG